MTDQRLDIAFADPGALPATGRIVVFGPRADMGLAAVPKARLRLVQGFRPDHDAFAGRGYDVTPALGTDERGFAAALVVLPRARGEARGLVAEAVARVLPGAPVWVDGQKTDGIETMLKDIRARAAATAPISKAHGKIFRVDAPDPGVFADWIAAEIAPCEGFLTLPGVFSAEKVDRGSALLAEALPRGLAGRVADLGAGWGWLAAQILTHEKVTELHLIEADHRALGCARRNVVDPRAVFHWADVTQFTAPVRFEAVVTNPPFHTGRAADPGLGAAFIRAGAAMLVPAGVLWLVANRHLPYEPVLTALFRDVEEIGTDHAFKILRAARPQTAAAPSRPRG